MTYAGLLASELRTAHLQPSEAVQTKLARYCEELSRWNAKVNLTGLRGADLVRRLVVEPIWIGEKLQPDGVLADIGSGNGSPGIPLSITCKLRAVHLIEARTRRAAFLRHASGALKLDNVRVHHGIFEDIVGEVGPVDWVTLQGVAPTRELLQAIHKVAKPTTSVVWITSGVPEGAQEREVLRIRVPFTNTRVLLLKLD